MKLWTQQVVQELLSAQNALECNMSLQIRIKWTRWKVSLEYCANWKTIHSEMVSGSACWYLLVDSRKTQWNRWTKRCKITRIWSTCWDILLICFELIFYCKTLMDFTGLYLFIIFVSFLIKLTFNYNIIWNYLLRAQNKMQSYVKEEIKFWMQTSFE